MSRAAETLSEKIQSLSPEQLAEVEEFIESLQLHTDRAEGHASAFLSEHAFEAVWNNPEDDVYDAL
jgi:hypothetical protein